MAKQGDPSLLKGTRYWWLKGVDKLSIRNYELDNKSDWRS